MKHYLSILLVCLLICSGCSSPTLPHEASSTINSSGSTVPPSNIDHYFNAVFFYSASDFASAVQDAKSAKNGEDSYDLASMQEFYIPSFIPQDFVLGEIKISPLGYCFTYFPKADLALGWSNPGDLPWFRAFYFSVAFEPRTVSLRELYQESFSYTPHICIDDNTIFSDVPAGYTVKWIQDNLEMSINFDRDLSTQSFEEAQSLVAYKGAIPINLNDFASNNYTQQMLDFPPIVSRHNAPNPGLGNVVAITPPPKDTKEYTCPLCSADPVNMK